MILVLGLFDHILSIRFCLIGIKLIFFVLKLFIKFASLNNLGSKPIFNFVRIFAKIFDGFSIFSRSVKNIFTKQPCFASSSSSSSSFCGDAAADHSLLPPPSPPPSPAPPWLLLRRRGAPATAPASHKKGSTMMQRGRALRAARCSEDPGKRCH